MTLGAAFRSVGIDAPLVIDGRHGSRGIRTAQKLPCHTGGWGWPPYGGAHRRRRGKRWIIQPRTFKMLSIMTSDV